jgi:hypothetical protein
VLVRLSALATSVFQVCHLNYSISKVLVAGVFNGVLRGGLCKDGRVVESRSDGI